MCGIAGILSFAPGRAPASPALVAAMRDTMAHRGPDGAGLWDSGDGRIALGHRRLAIIDLSTAATQPMIDGDLALVFNGEIYNHAELRRELIALGHRDWRTDHSDTEVVLKAFRQWGITCIERFRGMFAIALWDGAAQEMWLVRDRIGVKPLYWAMDSDGIAFASEIKAILADPNRRRVVDEEALFHFLSFITTPAPMTMFAGIRKLEAGCWMRISAGGHVVHQRWWDVLDHAQPRSLSEGEWAEAVAAKLREAVAYRKVSDVPVGIFLSGGIDSSTNLVLFSEGEGGPVRTFSIGYEGTHASVADELPHARAMAALTGAEHHDVRLTPQDLIDFLPRMVHLQDEPIADPVCVPVYYVSKLARDNGVVVAQVGEGADELFYGYPGWHQVVRLERLNALPVPRFLKGLGVSALEAAGHGRRTYTELLRRASRGQPLFWGGAEAFSEPVKSSLLSPRLRQTFAGRSSWEVLAPIRARFLDKSPEPGVLNWMTYLDLNLRLPELLLMRVDKMSMGVGLEARVPFLDHELVELAMSAPESVKLGGGDPKRLLKRAVGHLLPDEVLNRPKQGFAIPIREWFLDRLGDKMRRTLDEFCETTSLLDPAGVRRLFDEGRGAQAWYLFNLALWWRHHFQAGDQPDNRERHPG
ncbi:asparagine synthase (glutamine-hydrolyzing) [Magnetospirillum sp. 15-1]|uniref:asparagine synthase (glutamine-hydrolyzing) n=1 Tax=Magnetospirillum sp. 15-1 TaxID=1979370 RepID=UPI000BBB7674|nr:asparagine synthase (glutamine-hydrolyzing) [Magnetospirillum sp. 15-1]